MDYHYSSYFPRHWWWWRQRQSRQREQRPSISSTGLYHFIPPARSSFKKHVIGFLHFMSQKTLRYSLNHLKNNIWYFRMDIFSSINFLEEAFFLSLMLWIAWGRHVFLNSVHICPGHGFCWSCKKACKTEVTTNVNRVTKETWEINNRASFWQ